MCPQPSGLLSSPQHQRINDGSYHTKSLSGEEAASTLLQVWQQSTLEDSWTDGLCVDMAVGQKPAFGPGRSAFACGSLLLDIFELRKQLKESTSETNVPNCSHDHWSDFLSIHTQRGEITQKYGFQEVGVTADHLQSLLSCSGPQYSHLQNGALTGCCVHLDL